MRPRLICLKLRIYLLYRKDDLEDAEVDIPVKVQDLLNRISEAKGIIIATPEYDHAIPAVLKVRSNGSVTRPKP